MPNTASMTNRRVAAFCACVVLWLFAIATQLTSCGKAKTEPEQVSATERVTSIFKDASKRLLDGYLSDGYVVSRKADGTTPDHEGEGGLWAWVALGTLSCADAKPLADALVDHMAATSGAIRRFEPLPDEYKGRELNFDGETGLEYGLAAYVTRCPADKPRMAQAWAQHTAAIATNRGQLYPGTGEKMAPGFGFLGHALSHELNGAAGPSEALRLELEQATAGWVYAVTSKKAAAYPLNLSYLHLRGAEALSYRISDVGRAEFCAAAAPAAVPDIESWCGRGNMVGWIDGYAPNRFEFQFQRGVWESPDGQGDFTPGLDLLFAIRQAYALND